VLPCIALYMSASVVHVLWKGCQQLTAEAEGL